MPYPRTPLPYVLEDRTGLSTYSDFDEIYDRSFFRVAASPTETNVVHIYTMPQRATRHRDSIPFDRKPSVVMEFSGRSSEIGTVSFVQPDGNLASMPMSKYLRKTSLFAGSRSRKFVGSDGTEYRWSFAAQPGREWSCTTVDNHLVAHYDLKAPETRAYGVSGNSITIYERFSHLSIEILTTLTIMRYLAEHGL